MSTRTEYQTIKGADGRPAFIVIPYEEFLGLKAASEALIPHAVVSAVVDGASPVRAWREHLGLTQAEIARRMGISQAGFAQIEAGGSRPRKATLRNVAAALGISLEQLDI